LAAPWGNPFRLWPPDGGVRANHPTPSGVLRYRSDLHDAADYSVVGERVEIGQVCANARTVRKKAKAREPPASPASPSATGRTGAKEFTDIRRIFSRFSKRMPTWSLANEFREPRFMLDLLMQDGER
jgi:hypothetical protein